MTLIVAAVDGSTQSQRALAWALRHAASRDGTVQAIMVVSTKDLADSERTARLAAAERTVARMAATAVEACARPPTLTYEVVEGDPSVVLVDATHRADLIVFGSHEMSSLRNPSLSTVSLACIRMGACPVVVIPAGASAPAPRLDLVLG